MRGPRSRSLWGASCHEEKRGRGGTGPALSHPDTQATCRFRSLRHGCRSHFRRSCLLLHHHRRRRNPHLRFCCCRSRHCWVRTRARPRVRPRSWRSSWTSCCSDHSRRWSCHRSPRAEASERAPHHTGPSTWPRCGGRSHLCVEPWWASLGCQGVTVVVVVTSSLLCGYECQVRHRSDLPSPEGRCSAVTASGSPRKATKSPPVEWATSLWR